MRSKMLILFMLVLPAIVVTQARADMVAYWPLDTGTGGTAFDAYDDYDGTLVDEPAWVSGYTGGAGDYALEFNYDNSVNFGNVPTGPNLTLAFWMYSALSDYEMPIGAAPEGYYENPGWMVMARPASDNEIWFRVTGEQGAWDGGDVVLSGAGTPNTWIHLAFTFDGTTRELIGYVNGEYVNTKVCEEGRSVDGTDDLWFGDGGGESFKGVVDDVALWSHVLNADEVRGVYENGPLPPSGATKPDPKLGQTGVNPNTLLSWEPPLKAVDTPTYDVYFVADDPNLLELIANDITETSVDPNPTGDLDYMRTYYWRVDAYYTEAGTAGPELYEGQLWYFTTGGLARDPLPADGAVAVWTSPTLTWTGDDWASGYRVYIGTAAGVWDLVNGELITETSYALSGLDVFDDYFWKVEELDEGGNPFLPGQANTWSCTTGGLVAKILRDTEDLTDTSGRSHNALTEGSTPPTLVDGTASFAGTLGSYLVIDPNSGDPADLMTNKDFTWSLWLNSDPVPDPEITDFVSAQVVRAPIDGTWPEGSKKLVTELWYGDVYLDFDTTEDGYGTYAWVGTYGQTNLLDGTWHHCAVTANAATGQVSLFMDGALRERGSHNLTAGDDSSLITQIGRMPAGSTPVAFSGRMTDIRIYSACLPDEVVEDVYQDSHWAIPVNPEDTATDITPAIVLEWIVPSDTVSQVLYFDPNEALVAAGDSSVSNPLAGNVSTYDPLGIDDLELETTYYWRIDTVDTFGNTWPGRTYSFTTAEAGPFGPTPEDGAEGIHPVGVVLEWGSTAKNFDHEVWFGDSPYDLTLIDTVGYTGSMSTELDPLQWQTTYFWQIVATDGEDVFTGPMWSFTTIVPDCTEEIPGDANDDCQVNLEDLALVASGWLTCNREPQESCFE